MVCKVQVIRVLVWVAVMVVVMVFTKLMLMLIAMVLVGIMGDYRVGDGSLPDCHMLLAISVVAMLVAVKSMAMLMELVKSMANGHVAGGGQVDGHVDCVSQVNMANHADGVGQVDSHVAGVGRHHGR